MKLSRTHASLLLVLILLGCGQDPKKEATTRATGEPNESTQDAEVAREERETQERLKMLRQQLQQEWEDKHPLRKRQPTGLEKKSDLGPVVPR